MKRVVAWTVLLAAVGGFGSSPADEPARPIEEFHEVVHLDGLRVGLLHTTVTRHDANGKQLRASALLELTLSRYGSPVRLRREEGSIETPEGKVLAVYMRQAQSGGKQLSLVGLVRPDGLQVKVDGGRIERTLPWPADALGIRGQDRFLAGKKLQTGDRFTFHRFESTYNAILNVRVEVKDRVSVDVLGVRRPLLRVELTPDKLTVPGQAVQPPRTVWWLDENNVAVRRQMEMDGLGTLVLTRTSRDKARAPAGPPADVGTRSLVSLSRPIPRPYDTRSVVYRISVREGTDPRGLLVSDAHQEVRRINARDNTFELAVQPVQSTAPRANVKAPAEFLATCRYIDCDHPRIKEMARKAAASETDPWRKALRIERWVKLLMRTDNSAALGPASEAARTLRGDCRHHALLTAALCRAEGIPSRTAVGLLYVFRGGPKLGFHMWTEVFVGGAWLGVDSTLGKGGVSATHVKISDHSWDHVESLTPLLPASRVIGNIRVDVVRIEK